MTHKIGCEGPRAQAKVDKTGCGEATRQDGGRSVCADKGNGICEGTVRGGRGGHVPCSLCRKIKHNPRTPLLGMKAVQLLWETLWLFLKTLKLEWPHDQQARFWVCTQKNGKQGLVRLRVTAKSFTIANKRKPPKRHGQMWHINTTEQDSVFFFFGCAAFTAAQAGLFSRRSKQGLLFS